jgi:3-phosphoshikimate 1-carboxyvinyltransferase
MNVQIRNTRIYGSVSASASKSFAQRALAASLLCQGESIINGYTACGDSETMINIIESLGAHIERNEDKLQITSAGYPNMPQISTRKIFCGESGLALRLLAPLSLLFNSDVILYGKGSLLMRQFTNICDTFSRLGIECKSNDSLLPLHISGSLKSGEIYFDGSEGSQLLSGLLMALPLLDRDSFIKVDNLQSKSYIDLTIKVLRNFGIDLQHNNYELFEIKAAQQYTPCQCDIEGDWSGASCLLVAGAIAGCINITGLDINSEQADKAIVKALKHAGADVKLNNKHVEVSKDALRAFNFDATHCPDLFPALAVLAANCNGISRISGTNRLVNKESNRALTIQSELANVGIRTEIRKDYMLIYGGEIYGGECFAHNDHRIAMAMAVAGLTAKNPITVRGAECVGKSYQSFFIDLNKLYAE